MTKACSTCGTLNPEDATFCENCGADLGQSTSEVISSNSNGKPCPNCGTQNEIDTTFCTNCGFIFQPMANMYDSQPIQQRPESKKLPVWPWLLGGFVVFLLVVGGGYYYYTQVSANQNKVATSSSSSKKTSSNEKSTEEKQIEAENASLRATQKNSRRSSQESSSQAKVENKETEAAKTITLTSEQKESIIGQFTSWAGKRAERGNMAVSSYYFAHGSAGQGDWYANTPNGKVQVQDNNHPGYGSFKIHAIGGFIFYTSIDGQIGIDDTLSQGTIAQGYSVNLDSDHPVSKYMLADDGIVYELKLGNGKTVALSDGFAELTDKGQESNVPADSFIISNDQAAQNEYAHLLQIVK